jgi:hypothetical protein
MTEYEDDFDMKNRRIFKMAFPNGTSSTKNYQTIPVPPFFHRRSQWNGLAIHKNINIYHVPLTRHASPQSCRGIALLFV